MKFRAGFLVLAVGLALTGTADDGQIVDPFEVVDTFDRFSKMELWPGFNATAYPIAVFDGQRTLLFRHPDPTDEFRPLEGYEGVWASPGKHPAMRWNSNADIGGTTTATLLLTIEPDRSVEYEAHILFHEVFHLFSKPLHPTWRPNEMWRYSYPMDDVDNYRQLLLEEEALARAVNSETDDSTASWTAAALAIRTQRTAKLSEEHRTFETALELQEGTAVYMGRSAIGIADDMDRLLEERGPEGIRWRCYETGSAIAVVLDRLLPAWKQTLAAEPDTTFTELLEMAITSREVTPATFTTEELTSVSNRAEAAISDLKAERAALYEDFSSRGKRVVVRLADEDEQFGTGRFNPMAVEVLDRGEVLQAHFLTADHLRGEVSLQNPHYSRNSLDGVVALTTPASEEHPFLYGYRQIAVSGFSGDPTVVRDGNVVTIEAEGLKLEFNGARVVATDEELAITVLPAGQVEE
jgi:hypothetical protein